jgi:uncharacterized protein YfiM (DUF2279 family)|tara:strand:- start:5999 stop:6367 length:369 start_codon:yes stop_codon:yes gene_type:complete
MIRLVVRAILFLCLCVPLLKAEPSEKKSKVNTSIDHWIAVDKAQHFSYSCLISFGVQYLLVNKIGLEERTAMPISGAASFTAGFIKEVHDSKRKNGFFSKKDLTANSLGIIIASFIIISPSK